MIKHKQKVKKVKYEKCLFCDGAGREKVVDTAAQLANVWRAEEKVKSELKTEAVASVFYFLSTWKPGFQVVDNSPRFR